MNTSQHTTDALFEEVFAHHRSLFNTHQEMLSCQTEQISAIQRISGNQFYLDAKTDYLLNELRSLNTLAETTLEKMYDGIATLEQTTHSRDFQQL